MFSVYIICIYVRYICQHIHVMYDNKTININNWSYVT